MDNFIIKKNKLTNDKCRSCLKNDNLVSIFFERNESNSDIKLADMLMACASVQILEDDGLPQFICNKCVSEVQQAFSFKQKCEESDLLLRSLYIEASDKDKSVSYVQEEKSKKRILLSNELIADNCASIIVGVDKKSTEDISCSTKNILDCKIKQNAKNSKNLLLDLINEDSNNLIPVYLECTYLNNHDKYSNNVTKTKLSFQKTTNSKSIKLQKYKDESHLSTKEREKDQRKKIRKYYTCNICSMSFARICHLKVHSRTHTNEKPYSCDICGRKFSQNSNLMRHKMLHTGERPFQCNICSKGFIQKIRLDDHMRIHRGEDPFVCSRCGKLFKTNASFMQHQKKHIDQDSVETNHLEYICEICNRSYATKDVLKVHLKSHGERTFLCSYCGKGFYLKAHLYRHLKIHTGERPFKCNDCGKSFTQHAILNSHKLIHTGNKPYACDVCNKPFTQRGHLLYHSRIHSGEKPFSCSMCNKAFAQKGNLTVHMRTHTGETPYSCSICGKGFYDSSNMKKHKKSHNDFTVA